MDGITSGYALDRLCLHLEDMVVVKDRRKAMQQVDRLGVSIFLYLA